MEPLDSLLARLRAFNLSFNRPASAVEVSLLGGAIRCKVPDDLRRVYLNHNGYRRLHPPPWRLLSIPEAIRANDGFFDPEEDAFDEPAAWPQSLRFFWTDDNSNHAGLYVRGPLAGRVCLEYRDDHD